MKAYFELTVDENTGEPIIKFRHYDKSTELEQKLLKVFLNKAIPKGLEIKRISGYLDCGTSNSWENYEIRTK